MSDSKSIMQDIMNYVKYYLRIRFQLKFIPYKI